MRGGDEDGAPRASSRRRCRSASPPTAATWCPTRPSARSAGGSPRPRRSARSPASARCPATSTRSRSPSPAPPPAGSARPTPRTQTDLADARRAGVPGDGALRHAGGDGDAARRRRRQHRRVDRRARSSRPSPTQEGTAFVTGDGDQQADRLPRLHQDRRSLLGVDQDRLRRHRRLRRLRRRATRPTIWSTSSTR